VLDLIDKKPTGILPLLDEEVILPRTTDDTFLRKLGENHERKHKRYQRPKGNASRFSFGVLHYAGSVTYAVDGFLQKNKDELSPDIVAVLQTSTNVHVSKIFALPVIMSYAITDLFSPRLNMRTFHILLNFSSSCSTHSVYKILLCYVLLC